MTYEQIIAWVSTLSFEQVLAYVMLSLTLAHKVIDIAKLIAARTSTTADDELVGKWEARLTRVSELLSYLPMIRQRLQGGVPTPPPPVEPPPVKRVGPLALVFVGLCLASCVGSAQTPTAEENAAKQAVKVVEKIRDVIVEVCLSAHQINARTHVDPDLNANRDKIDSVCDPAIETIHYATSEQAYRLLVSIRSTLDKITGGASQ